MGAVDEQSWITGTDRFGSDRCILFPQWYAFFIGYFICRLAIAWPQASVSAYYVAYAQNPENFPFESTINERLNQFPIASQSPSTPEMKAIQEVFRRIL
ncbi:unnamed protein product [Vicia faba]|uniref:Uncharacterized protein n=1 Tax=Vicia faba TaxID=3906 RepID=A0AAV1AWZ6_VICFA|nr:unnamed protein product [Vicia faba]